VSPEPNSPLTEDHLQQLNNALDAVKRARTQIELARRVGIDVDALQTANDANEAKIRSIKQVYFAGR
jgi:nicotinate-nucleotide pyrophosphorylase